VLLLVFKRLLELIRSDQALFNENFTQSGGHKDKPRMFNPETKTLAESLGVAGTAFGNRSLSANSCHCVKSRGRFLALSLT
jgi:hypothetical protein